MSETPACGSCKQWRIEEDYDWEASLVGFNRCMAVRERWRIADEVSDNLEPMADKEAAGDRWVKVRCDALTAARAYVQDGSEYRADLMTGPDFFCALYEHGTPEEAEE